jgi:hypothetical protein
MVNRAGGDPMKRSDIGYVADRRQYLSDGRLNLTSGGWMVMWWDEGRKIHVEGATYRTKAEATEALREAARAQAARSEAAAALGRLGGLAGVRKGRDYTALGEKGGKARQGYKAPPPEERPKPLGRPRKARE